MRLDDEYITKKEEKLNKDITEFNERFDEKFSAELSAEIKMEKKELSEDLEQKINKLRTNSE